ncbi:hypothetical protein [Paenibacillus pini]|uniref:Uncharacterized protein n=1 Tax=Paenibacillus pini JCM 16418 TaxID=1236976 RepID=W7YV65_9BACL|nr:hypothetical protein [Paenibacillus pini]GAF08501.1 hypothetical protein JCM16418_2582 [Paenibacillus pini JCM 16418]
MKKMFLSLTLLFTMVFSFASSAFAYSETWPADYLQGTVYLEGNYTNTGSTTDILYLQLYQVTPRGDQLVSTNTVTLGAGQSAVKKVLIGSNLLFGQYRLVLSGSNFWSVAAGYTY